MAFGKIRVFYRLVAFYKKMLFGIDMPGVIKFLMQASAATAGAVSFWIFIFYLKKQGGLAQILIPLFLASAAVFFLSWASALFFAYPQSAAAHEGLRLMPSAEFIASGLSFTIPFVFLTALLTLWGMFYKKYGAWFFLAQFALWSIVISSLVNTGSLSIEQIFYIFHGWHSILTLGTVIAVDFLFVAVRKRNELKKFLYNFFPFMSAAIWTGLGIDMLTNLLVFEKVFRVTEQFLFTQAVVVIIIINGAILSGKINGWMTDLIKPGGEITDFSPRQKKIAEISGAISITSWVTITFIDGFALAASYNQLLLVYLLAIAAVYFTKPLAEGGIEKLASMAPEPETQAQTA